MFSKKMLLIVEQQMDREHEQFTGITNPAGPACVEARASPASRLVTDATTGGQSTGGDGSSFHRECSSPMTRCSPRLDKPGNGESAPFVQVVGEQVKGEEEWPTVVSATATVAETEQSPKQTPTLIDDQLLALDTRPHTITGSTEPKYISQAAPTTSRRQTRPIEDMVKQAEPRHNQVAPSVQNVGRRGSKILGEEGPDLGEKSRHEKFFGSDGCGGGVDHNGSFRRRATTVGKVTSVIKALPHPHHQRTIKDCLLYRILQPMFITMTMCGIFFIKPLAARAFSGGRLDNWSISKMYCCSIMALLTASTVRCIFAFDLMHGESFGNELFFKVLWTIFWYECLSRSYLSLGMSWKKKHNLEEFLLTLERICYPDEIVPYESDLLRAQRWALFYCLLSSCCYVGICAVGLFGSANLRQLFYGEFLRPFPEDFIYMSYVEGSILTLLFISAFINAASLSFFIIICYILYKEFEYTCRAFAMKIQHDGTFTDDLEKFRVMHQKRCKLVEQADGLYKMYVANAYLTLSPILCLQLYNIVYTDQVWQHRVVGLGLLAFVCVQMTLISLATISVNGQAHAPLEFIYGIRARMQEEAIEKRLAFEMFLNRLTGTSIGLTAWDMFVLNKPAMLTVSGMILTYFFLMAQLRYPSTIGTCLCVLFHGNGSETGVNITGRQLAASSS